MPPLAKRVEERRRRNIVPGETVATMHGTVEVPELSGVHPIAKAWYDSLKASGQGLFFEPSDWAAARYLATQMSRSLDPESPVNASLIASVWNAMNDLLTTEKARRHAKLQVQRVMNEQPEDAAPTALDDYRKALGQ